VSWRIISIDELARIIPVRPPIEKRNTNPILQRRVGLILRLEP
jgi:hypothetical protein